MMEKNQKRLSKLFLVIFVAAALLIGFSSTGAFAKAKNPLAVGSPQDLKNLFWVNWMAGFEEACKQLGLPTLAVDGQGQEATQLHGIEDAIVKGAKFLMVSPFGGVSGQTIVEQCDEAGVYVTMWSGMSPEDLPPAKYKHYTGWVTNYADPQGYLLAKELFKKLGGKGKIVALHGTPGGDHAEGRKRGMHEALKEFPGIKLLKEQTAYWRRQDALNLMADYLVTYPEIDGVVATNDEMGLGAIEAMRDANRMIPCTGLDAIEGALQAVRKGEMLFTINQDQYSAGALSAVFMYDHWKDFGKPKGNEKKPREGVVLMSELTKEDLPGWKSGKIGLHAIYKEDVTDKYIKEQGRPVVDWRLSSKAWCKENGVEYKGSF